MMPLATMIQILNVGLEWAGFPALAFYMHSVLKQLQVEIANMSFLSHLSSPKRKSFSSPSASIGWPLLLVDIDRLLFFPCLSSCELAVIVIVIIIVIVSISITINCN